MPDESSESALSAPCRDVVGDEGAVAAKPQVEGPGGHLRKHVPGPAQDRRLVLRHEHLLDVVEQGARRHREQGFVALVFEGLPRSALLGGGLLQLAVPSRVVQPGLDLRPLLDQRRVFVGRAGRCGELRFQSCALVFVGERDEVRLLREPVADQRLLGARRA